MVAELSGPDLPLFCWNAGKFLRSTHLWWMFNPCWKDKLTLYSPPPWRPGMVNGATGAFAAIIATFLPVPKETGKAFRGRMGRIFVELRFPLPINMALVGVWRTTAISFQWCFRVEGWSHPISGDGDEDHCFGCWIQVQDIYLKNTWQVRRWKLLVAETLHELIVFVYKIPLFTEF